METDLPVNVGISLFAKQLRAMAADIETWSTLEAARIYKERSDGVAGFHQWLLERQKSLTIAARYNRGHANYIEGHVNMLKEIVDEFEARFGLKAPEPVEPPPVVKSETAQSPLLADIKAGSRLSSTKFLLEDHCIKACLSPHQIWDFQRASPQPGWTYRGWCPSGSTVLPESHWGRDCPIAVLLESDGGEKVWCHVPTIPELVDAAFEQGRRRD